MRGECIMNNHPFEPNQSQYTNNEQDNNEKQAPMEQQFEAYYREVEQLPPVEEKKRKKSKFMPYMSAFMAGAIMIGGLMVAADRMNIFTGNGNIPYTISQSAGSSSSAGIVTASEQVSTDQSVSEVYATATKAVVEIENYSEPEAYSMFDNAQMWQYFGGVPGGQGGQGGSQRNSQGMNDPYQQDQGSGAKQDKETYNEEDLELSGTGTGFIVNESGYIVTNAHVISGGKLIKVTVEGYDEPMTAKVVSSDSDLDIAVLKIETPDGAKLPILPIADSDSIEVGQWVLAIGNPYGYDHTLTMGVISSTERPITIQNDEGEAQVYEHMLQTDASINPGNSGGPLLNEAGQVIGMNTAVSAEAQGIGFAIPSNIIVDYIQTEVSTAQL